MRIAGKHNEQCSGRLGNRAQINMTTGTRSALDGGDLRNEDVRVLDDVGTCDDFSCQRLSSEETKRRRIHVSLSQRYCVEKKTTKIYVAPVSIRTKRYTKGVNKLLRDPLLWT
jgi:hypothetical protein